MFRYILLGGEAGFIIWMAFQVILMPARFMMDAEDERLAAIGTWVDATTAPLEEIWNVPLEITLYCVEGLGFSEGFSEWLGSALMFLIPATAGALAGLALYGLTCLPQRRREPPRSGSPPAAVDPANIPRPVNH
ncbi:MAG: hypothetical protein R6V07_07375 [Armatimonadota bacterium]